MSVPMKLCIEISKKTITLSALKEKISKIAPWVSGSENLVPYDGIYETKDAFFVVYDIPSINFITSGQITEKMGYDYYRLAEIYIKNFDPESVLLAVMGDEGWNVSSYFEYYKDVNLFCVENPEDERTLEHIRKIISREEIINILKSHSPDGIVETPNGFGIYFYPESKNDFYIRGRFFLRKELRKRGLNLIGFTEDVVADLGTRSREDIEKTTRLAGITEAELFELKKMVEDERKKQGVKYLGVSSVIWHKKIGDKFVAGRQSEEESK